ncbi:MAG: chemotaxis protein CheD [Prolixibacteraceae bacterium]
MNLTRPNHHFLFPSNLFVSKNEEWITTVLGSCVSVCLYDSTSKIGGINHFMLPYWNGDGLESPRFGNVAIVQLFQKMIDLGAKKSDIVCKIFGGAEVLSKTDSIFNIGQRNIELAYKVVAELGIPVKGSSTGGKFGRKIHFNSGTGEVLQKYLAKTNQTDTK